MTPEERKAKNRLWRRLAALASRWEGQDGIGYETAARELREQLETWKPSPAAQRPTSAASRRGGGD